MQLEQMTRKELILRMRAASKLIDGYGAPNIRKAKSILGYPDSPERYADNKSFVFTFDEIKEILGEK